MADLKDDADKKAEPKVKQTNTGSLSILDSITKPVKDKLDQVDKSVNPFRKVSDQLQSGGKP
jgi:hypothetical protein